MINVGVLIQRVVHIDDFKFITYTLFALSMFVAAFSSQMASGLAKALAKIIYNLGMKLPLTCAPPSMGKTIPLM